MTIRKDLLPTVWQSLVEFRLLIDDISSHHSDISAMCCEVILSFVIFAVLVLRLCCSRPYKML